MDQGRSFVRRVFFRTFALIFAAAGVSLVAGAPGWARGFALGGAASLVNLLLTAGAVRGQVWGPSGKGVKVGAFAAYTARMGITAAALIFAAMDDRVNFWAALPALFASQLVLVAAGITEGTGGKPEGPEK